MHVYERTPSFKKQKAQITSKLFKTRQMFQPSFSNTEVFYSEGLQAIKFAYLHMTDCRMEINQVICGSSLKKAVILFVHIIIPFSYFLP